MKKIFILMIVLFFMTSNLHAQGDKPADQKFRFGLKAAPSLAWLKTDSKGIASEGTKLGFSYGLIAEFYFGAHYAFATGIDVSYRGGKLKSTSTANNSGGNVVTTVVTSDYNIQYVELPITLKFKTNEIGYLTYYLQAGISPGFCIRAKADVTTDQQVVTPGGTIISSSATSEDNVDVIDNINNVNLSMIIGGGVEYTISGSTGLMLGITFNNGFLDVSDDSNTKVNSNFLALTVGILF